LADGDRRSPHNQEAWKRLSDCLDMLRDEGVIRDWRYRAVDAGPTDAPVIERLKRSDIIIFALGQNYLDHPECYGEVLKNLPESRRYLVFSLLLFAGDWDDSPFIKFNLLPSNKAPVTESSDIEAAFIEIKEAIKQARLAIYPPTSKLRSLKEDLAWRQPEPFESTGPPEIIEETPYSTGSLGPPEPFDIFEEVVEDESSSIIALPPLSTEFSPAPIEPPVVPTAPLSRSFGLDLPKKAPVEPPIAAAPSPVTPETREPTRENDIRRPAADKSSSTLNREELEFERSRIVTDAARRGDVQPDKEAQKDVVDCTVFAPPSAPRDSLIFVQVYAHLREQADEALEMASEFDPEAKRRAVKSLEETVERGARLSFELTMPGLRCADPIQSVVWRGSPDAAQFAVEIPGDCPLGARVGSVVVSAHSIPIGHIKFKLQITEPGSEKAVNVAVGDEAKRYSLAYISYASADRSKVLARVQMLSLVGIQYFQDVLSLKPGDKWETE